MILSHGDTFFTENKLTKGNELREQNCVADGSLCTVRRLLSLLGNYNAPQAESS